MPDKILIKNLACKAIIGILPEERVAPQPLNINLAIETDTTAAAFTADLGQTIDYARIAQEVAELAVGAEAHLLETLAEDIAKYVLSHERALGVTVALDKPAAIDNAETVGIEIYRSR
jgi:FolB domain-containing protein